MDLRTLAEFGLLGGTGGGLFAQAETKAGPVRNDHPSIPDLQPLFRFPEPAMSLSHPVHQTTRAVAMSMPTEYPLLPSPPAVQGLDQAVVIGIGDLGRALV